MMRSEEPSIKTLSVFDAMAVTVGVVIGAGIFKTPSLVAAYAGNEWMALFIWLAGGVVSLVGALCYAELTSTYPHQGGDYHYLKRAFGNPFAFLFVWSRMTVIQTGSIAMLGFIIGDYASEIVRVGNYSPSWYAGLIILILTGINIAGISQGKRIQKLLITSTVLGMIFIVASGFALTSPAASFTHITLPMRSSIGRAMIFVLLTYGGWNEAAYLSAEVRDAHRNMFRVLVYSIGIITAIYLIINFVFLKSLGILAVSNTEVVASDLMRRVLGENGARFISLMILIAALGTMNGTIITGARTNYALGKDFKVFNFLGQWHKRGSTPIHALLLQGAIALGLVILGTGSKSGFVMMVEYTAPIFWFFFLLVGISLFILRRKEPAINRPFRVPLYPVTPVLFCFFCIYMLQSSLAYTGKGALLGVTVLVAGIPFLLVEVYRKRKSLLRKEK